RFHVSGEAPADATEIVFSIPLVIPKKGDVLTIDVTDAFVVSRRLSRFRVTFDDTVPMALEGRVAKESLMIGPIWLYSGGERASGECRRVPRSAVEGELT